MFKARSARVILLAALLGVSSSVSAAEDPRTYAVMSLVGDKMSVVTYQISTGSGIDKNRRETIDVNDGLFDKTVLMAAESALSAGTTKPRVQLFAPTAPSLFERQDRFFSGSKVVLPEVVSAALKSDGATHLLLVTKYRGEARMQADGAKLGSGIVEGLGFYVDHSSPMISTKSMRESNGFLAPFAFMRLSLVDLATSAVLRQKVLTASFMLITADTKDELNPWNVLGPAEKIDHLRGLIERELETAVPQLVASP